ncbi:hypothetical protein BJ912DRAFT_944416 [Pholiota molesta]|nr:hypothetical protein BJ912DRAFT_944416 [Pholiota molesta]
MSSHPAHPISAGTLTGAVPSWPRRASKACASCRRDKIRCDGSRPCSGCKKKGYAADQCTDGCEACRHARVRCEEGKPCRRCVEMGFECSVDSPAVPYTQSTAPTSGSSLPFKGKPNQPQHLEKQQCPAEANAPNLHAPTCDDQRPCSRCIARSEECVHLPRGPKLIKLRCEGCRMDNKRCEETRPCGYCSDAGKICVTAARKGRGHGTRVKTVFGCWSLRNVLCSTLPFRRDKIRCNGDRPCASCVKKGCECVERPCQACVESDTASECTHKKTFPEAAPLEVEVPPPKRDDYRSSGHFHTLRSTAVVVNGHPRPQWESYAPGPHAHPLQDTTYPAMMPQAQYYFPPTQQAYHSTQPHFPPPAHPPPFSAAVSQFNYYYDNNNDDGRSRVYAPSSANVSSDVSEAFPAPRRSSG